jgi:hypothetical protein
VPLLILHLVFLSKVVAFVSGLLYFPLLVSWFILHLPS